jgi:hypothetical protein
MNYSKELLKQMLPVYILNKLGYASLPEEAEDYASLTLVINRLIKHRGQLQQQIVSIKQYLATLDEEFLDKQSGSLRNLFVSSDTINTLADQISQQRQLLEDTEKELEESRLNIDTLLNDRRRECYMKLIEAFDQLITSDQIKTVSPAKSARPELFQLDCVQSSFAGLKFPRSANGDIIVYPTFLLIRQADEEFAAINLKQVRFEYKELQEKLVSQVLQAKDATVIEYVWAKVNNDGSRDLRYKSNYQQAVIRFSEMTFTATDVNETYHFSNVAYASQFAKDMEMLLYQIKVKPASVFVLPFLSRQYIAMLEEFTTEMVAFVRTLQADASLAKFLTDVKGLELLNKNGPARMIELLFQLDLIKIFHAVADLENVRSKESFALLFVQDKMAGPGLITVDSIEQLYSSPAVTAFTSLYKMFSGELTDNLEDEKYFKFAYLLTFFNQDVKAKYTSLLYQFASIVIKADGLVSQNEQDVLARIMKTPRKAVAHAVTASKVISSSEHFSTQEVLQELNELIGLAAVKQQVTTLVNFIKIQKSREESGLKKSSLSYHIVFTGSPGTGKTTVARIVSKLFKSLGILTSDKLVETDRAGLVAEYVGQTAVKTNKLIDSAIDGVLFIDEAYALAVGGNQDYGKEAVATLLKRMEDDRDKLVVILAGYETEMKSFIDMNPGLQSRFNRYVQFEDYSADELVQIFDSFCRKADYVLSDDARQKLTGMLQTVYTKRDKYFGNGRYVRNQFEKTLELQANRLASVIELDKEMLTTITAADIPSGIH